MSQENLTVWQRLSKTFGPNSLLNQDYPTFKFDKKELLRTPNRDDYEKEKLQAQQTFYLTNQWAKVENNLYSQAVYYEPSRLSAQYDYESMEYCIAGDTKIATPDGFITIKELADKGKDYEFITYSYDHNLKKVVPSKGRNAHYTRDEMTYKVIFDDGSFIITTWEHQLMKRDGSFERVMNLKEGDSMMPFYRKSFYNNEKYNWVYTCNSDEGHHGWVSEHNLIAEWYHEVKIKKNEEVHHIDFNGKNNLPENLSIMDISEHRSYHAKLNNEKLWSNPDYRLKMSEVARRKGKMSWDGKRKGIKNPAYFSIPFDNIIETARIEKTLKKTSLKLNVSYRKLQRDITNSGYKDWQTFLDAYGIEKSKYSTSRSVGESINLNHKIVSIEPNGIIPVYDLTVPGYKNFATDTIFSHNTPEISAALDIYSEESTTTNEDGFILQIYSESKRIKTVLADLFNNSLDINTNLSMWTRNTCKYGDNFVYLKLDPEKGIVGCQQLPTIEIERRESGVAGNITIDITKDTDKKPLHFTWKNKSMEFQSWEIAHFRLLGDDRKLPYGTSMLEKARRIWKQLLLSEDAMLIYRTSRAPERRMFKVFVGNMNDDDVEAYVNRVANKFKREQIVDSKTGNVDMRFNQMAVDQDYFIPVRDPSAPDPITTLPGATNLSEIADIEYIQKKLLTALRVPKAFLGFEEVVGDGKNLALQDIRFARTINRIQKSMISELNKIAIVHLFLLGFEDELQNFTLGLTNPSTQADLLKIDVWKEKVLLYKDLVSDPGNGIQATSSTWAKEHIFGWSDEEIKLDLQQQRLERAVGEELKATPTVISKTGIFDNIDKLYGESSGSTGNASTTGAEGAPSEGGFESAPPAGDVAPPPAEPPAAEITPESKKANMNILLEQNFDKHSRFLNLSQGQDSLGEISKELDKLLNS
jgi:intein/homing endonuclease